MMRCCSKCASLNVFSRTNVRGVHEMVCSDCGHSQPVAELDALESAKLRWTGIPPLSEHVPPLAETVPPLIRIVDQCPYCQSENLCREVDKDGKVKTSCWDCGRMIYEQYIGTKDSGGIEGVSLDKIDEIVIDAVVGHITMRAHDSTLGQKLQVQEISEIARMTLTLRRNLIKKAREDAD